MVPGLGLDFAEVSAGSSTRQEMTFFVGSSI